MGTFLEWVKRISVLAAPPAVVVLGVALAVVLLARRRIFQVVGMAMMYFFVGVLHTQVLRPEVVPVKLLVGFVVCMAIATIGQPGARAAGEGEPAEPGGDPAPRPSGWKNLLRWPVRWSDEAPLRLVALVAAGLIAATGSLRFPLPNVPFLVGLACYLMAVVGLFLAGMAEEPLPVGLGLLIFLNGFDLFFGALDPSLVVAGLLGLVQFLVTLAVAHLTLGRT